MSPAIRCLPLGQVNVQARWLQCRALYAKTAPQKYKTEKQLLAQSCPDVLSIFTEYPIIAVLHLPCDKMNELLQFCHDYTCTILHLHFFLVWAQAKQGQRLDCFLFVSLFFLLLSGFEPRFNPLNIYKRSIRNLRKIWTVWNFRLLKFVFTSAQ